MLEIFKSANNFKDFHNSNNKSIGFVPTMGNLHLGHISLLKAAIEENEVAVISIYVNPTQFGANEDLDKYPRTWEHDLKIISELEKKYSEKKIIIFAPKSDSEIYPQGLNTTFVHRNLRAILEGAVRPTHFDGVTTVVKNLFDIVKPTKAYFGKKDYQQFIIIKDMVEELNLSVNIIGMPIVRESDGLAMSSRNQYLNDSQRHKALNLSKSIKKIKQILTIDLKKARQHANKLLIQDNNWNYLEIRNAKNLSIASEADNHLVILGNYQLGNTRLLDNFELEKNI